MDLSFEGENNFVLPEPARKLDFTEDEEKTTNCPNNEECDQAMNVSTTEETDEAINEESDCDEDFDEQSDQFVEEPFNKPIINQNLMLNKNRNNQAKNTFIQHNSTTGHQEPVTPAIIKRKQFKSWFNSPTDNCLSPCTQKLFKNKKPI